MITSLPNNKAPSVYQITAELKKAGHEVTNNNLALLLEWILCTSDVPAAWRGGRLARLNKGKGPTESTDSCRGLLIGDHTAKVCTGVLAPKVKKAIEQQCGNTRGRGKNRGHHVVSTFVRSVFFFCSWIKTQDSRNVNASIRAHNSSPTLDGRKPIYI